MYIRILILLLLSISSQAQVYQFIGTPIRVVDNRGYFMSDSGLKAFTVGDTISAAYLGAPDRIGDARLKNDTPYVRISTHWVPLATGTGGGSSDTISTASEDFVSDGTGIITLSNTYITGTWDVYLRGTIVQKLSVSETGVNELTIALSTDIGDFIHVNYQYVTPPAGSTASQDIVSDGTGVFTVSNPYLTGEWDVYLRGTIVQKLSVSETGANQFTLAVPTDNGDFIHVNYKY